MVHVPEAVVDPPGKEIPGVDEMVRHILVDYLDRCSDVPARDDP